MKLHNRVKLTIRGKNKEATAVEQSLKALIKKYGVDIVGYVSRRMLQSELGVRRLERDISQKEKELASMKEKLKK